MSHGTRAASGATRGVDDGSRPVEAGRARDGGGGAKLPPKSTGFGLYDYEVAIHGNSVVKYGGNDKPLLSCGARVVIETNAEVEVIR